MPSGRWPTRTASHGGETARFSEGRRSTPPGLNWPFPSPDTTAPFPTGFFVAPTVGCRSLRQPSPPVRADELQCSAFRGSRGGAHPRIFSCRRGSEPPTTGTHRLAGANGRRPISSSRSVSSDPTLFGGLPARYASPRPFISAVPVSHGRTPMTYLPCRPAIENPACPVRPRRHALPV